MVECPECGAANPDLATDCVECNSPLDRGPSSPAEEEGLEARDLLPVGAPEDGLEPGDANEKSPDVGASADDEGAALLGLGALLAGEAADASALAYATETVADGDLASGAGLGAIGIPPDAKPILAPPIRIPGDAPSRADDGELAARTNRLREFLRAGTGPDGPSRGPGSGRRDRLFRILVPAVLIATVVLAVVAPEAVRSVLGGVELPEGYPIGPARMHDSLRGVTEGEFVLVAFEYGPSSAEEMDLVAVPVLRQLQSQGALLAIVSTRPDGLVAARKVLRETLAEVVEAGEMTQEEADAIVASGAYRPGEALAVARLLQEAVDPDHVVVFAAQPAPLRRWVEQVRALSPPPPIVAGTSSAAEGVAAAYWSDEVGLLRGAVSGVSGAAYYERLASGVSDGPASRRLDALAAGNLAIVVLVIVGAALAGLPRNAFRRGGRT